MKYLLVFVILITLRSVIGLKILGIFGHAGRSHFDVFRPLLKALAEKGHELTVLGYFPLTEKIPRYKDVVLKYPGNEVKSTISVTNLGSETIEQYFAPYFAFQMTKLACDTGLASKEYKELFNRDDKYDVILAEYFVSHCFLLPFMEKTQVPVIGIQSHVLLAWNNEWVGNPYNPSYVPSSFLKKTDRMNFFDRVENALTVLANNLFYDFYLSKFDINIIQKHLGLSVVPKMWNTSLILTHSHFSLHKARPFVPSVVEIGGIHIPEKKPLPKHIEKWINESTHGVIYFSLGSMIKGHTFPEEKRQMFIRAFSRFPQRILWKWETDTMPGKPENIMIEKWMPQFDILSHPNVKAFIAHGGLLGATEAVHCGVPLIVMPQFGDQFTNAKAIEASGGGVILDYRSLDEESIYNALKTVLDPSFNKKAKELSARFRDRPMPPLETAIYWVEYVARHGGAPHLRTAAVGMPLYQYLLLDVIAFLSVILLLFSYISFVVTRGLFRLIFKSKQNTKIKKN